MLDTITTARSPVRLDLDALETAVRNRTSGRVRFLDVRLLADVLELRGLSPSWHLKAVAGAALRAATPASLYISNLIEVAD